LCHVQQKPLAKLQAARTQARECIAPNIRSLRLRIGSNATKNVVLRTLAATTNDISVGARLFSSVIRSAESQSFAADMRNQLKLITRLQSVGAEKDSRSQMVKALANPVIRGRRRQKTPIFLEAKGRGYEISTNRKPGNPPLTSRHTAAKKEKS